MNTLLAKKYYEVIEELGAKYPENFLRRLMEVNRSGYYKGRQRKWAPNRYGRNRIALAEFLLIAHERYLRMGTTYVFENSMAISLQFGSQVR